MFLFYKQLIIKVYIFLDFRYFRKISCFLCFATACFSLSPSQVRAKSLTLLGKGFEYGLDLLPCLLHSGDVTALGR